MGARLLIAEHCKYTTVSDPLAKQLLKRKMQQAGIDVVCKSILQELILQQSGVMRKRMKECL